MQNQIKLEPNLMEYDTDFIEKYDKKGSARSIRPIF